jgi:hypothetical protein
MAKHVCGYLCPSPTTPPPPFLPSLFTCSTYSSLVLLQCREIGFEIHEEVLKALHELHTAMKTHHAYQSEFRQAESKLQVRITK